MSTVLHICTTCRAGQPVPDGSQCAGANLFDALSNAAPVPGVTIKPVECLSACSNGCSIVLSKKGGWSYVFGNLTPDHVPEILQGAAAFAQSSDGVVPWRDRPEVFRKQCLARVPPIGADD